MRVLVVEDEKKLGELIGRGLREEGYAADVADRGEDALWMARAVPYDAIVLDVMLPGADGFEVCRRLRASGNRTPVLILTARYSEEDTIRGLDLGADDYLVKPFNRDELRARIKVGMRVVTLQQRLADRVAELEDAAATEKHLRGLLPICCYCKRIRTDQNYWQQIEGYVSEHSDARFSHGICPTCFPAAKAAMER